MMMMMMMMTACLMAHVKVAVIQKLLKVIILFYIPSFCMLFSAGVNETPILSVLDSQQTWKITTIHRNQF